jgi:hypothetical protein
MTSIEVAIAIGTAVLSSIVGPIAVHYVTLLTDKKKKETLDQYIESNELVNEKIESVRNDINADRIWILQFHNGGHFYPTGKSIQKFSMVYEVLRTGVIPCQHQFQNIPVSLFSKGINTLCKGKVICIKDTSVEEKQYEGITSVVPGANVKSTYIFPIYDIKNNFIAIVGIDFTDKVVDLDISQLTDIEIDISAIGGVLHDYLS